MEPTWIQHGSYMDPTWIPRGSHMYYHTYINSTHFEQDSSLYYTQILCGSNMDESWIQGVNVGTDEVLPQVFKRMSISFQAIISQPQHNSTDFNLT